MRAAKPLCGVWPPLKDSLRVALIRQLFPIRQTIRQTALWRVRVTAARALGAAGARAARPCETDSDGLTRMDLDGLLLPAKPAGPWDSETTDRGGLGRPLKRLGNSREDSDGRLGRDSDKRLGWDPG
jgi:hypothetical protein